ncbi:hypothetical protein, partial [Mesorhizobium sp. M7A.T.Ca.TU.009.02.1.1]|uniref:hypothetical protein n=1 Tax=Mesorhizobium sp. M7A.T.Ca.TU.009.02.1.1 TaxID=2496791 RepID=UPI0019D19BFA
MSIDRKPLLILPSVRRLSRGPNLVVPWRQGITRGCITEAALRQTGSGFAALADSRAKPRPIANQ